MDDNELPVAILTGAGGGIGRAIAMELSQEGYRLALVGRRRETLEETAEVLSGESLVLPADVSDAEQIAQTVEDTVNAFGRLDAAIHNAGLAPVRTVEEMTPQEWRAVIDTNLSAAFYLARAAWPTFRKQRDGVIVNISSFSSRDPFPGFAAYGAAKAGVNLLGLALGREGREHGIRVHTIAPAAVETPMFRQIMTTEQFPTEQTLAPEDVARVVAQCVTGDLRHTSGEVIFLQRS